MRSLPAWNLAQDGLNITACVDIFAVVAMYLMLCYTVSDTAQHPLSDIALPRSTAVSAPVQATRVSLSGTALRVDNQLVASLQSGQPAPADLDGAQHIVPLRRALEREKWRMLTATRNQSEFSMETQRPDVIYLEAAGGLPYAIIDKVVRTAAAAGFTHVRLAVYHKEMPNP